MILPDSMSRVSSRPDAPPLDVKCPSLHVDRQRRRRERHSQRLQQLERLYREHGDRICVAHGRVGASPLRRDREARDRARQCDCADGRTGVVVEGQRAAHAEVRDGAVRCKGQRARRAGRFDRNLTQEPQRERRRVRCAPRRRGLRAPVGMARNRRTLRALRIEDHEASTVGDLRLQCIANGLGAFQQCASDRRPPVGEYRAQRADALAGVVQQRNFDLEAAMGRRIDFEQGLAGADDVQSSSSAVLPIRPMLEARMMFAARPAAARAGP